MISDITKSSFDAAIFISENTQIVNEQKILMITIFHQ